MPGKRGMLCMAAAVVFFATQASANPTAGCDPKSGKLTARLLCLTTTVESLKAEIEELRRAQITQSSPSASNAATSDLERRLTALESREAKGGGETRPRRPTDKATMGGTSAAPVSGAAKAASRHAQTIYEGQPLVEVPNPRKLNGAAGVRGLPDTQSGDASRPAE